MITPNIITLRIAMFRSRHHSGLAAVVLISALALFGCSSRHPIEPSKVVNKAVNKPASASTAPVHKEEGEASWYGPGLQGNKTSSGETFDQNDDTAAHPSLPMGTEAEVTNLENGKKTEVKINDRGPYTEGRVIDVSRAAAKKLDMLKDGTTKVKIETKPKSKTDTGVKPTGKE